MFLQASYFPLQGLVKPDVVFFGEDLPKRFYLYLQDFPRADLLFVMGTSLEVCVLTGLSYMIVDPGHATCNKSEHILYIKPRADCPRNI